MKILRQKQFGFFGSLFKSNNKQSQPVIKKDKYKEKLENLEILRTDVCPKNVSPSHNEALRIEKELEPFYPGLGDGDEYPTFSVNTDGWDFPYGDDDEYEMDPDCACIKLGCLNEPVYKWVKDHWEDVDISDLIDNPKAHGRRVNNIKLDIIKYLKSELSSWENDEYGWGDEESLLIVDWINKLIEIISKSNLK